MGFRRSLRLAPLVSLPRSLPRNIRLDKQHASRVVHDPFGPLAVHA